MSKAIQLKKIPMVMWSQMGHGYYEGECGYPSDEARVLEDGTKVMSCEYTIHMMTVRCREDEEGNEQYEWYVEANNGHTREGVEDYLEDAQTACRDAANEIRGLPSIFDDEEEDEAEWGVGELPSLEKIDAV